MAREFGSDNENIGPLLRSLMKAASNNSNKKCKGWRYDNALKKMGSVLYLLCGKMPYEILHANLQSSLPSITTAKKLIDVETKILKMGIVRVRELKEWLVKHELRPNICVSEDLTKITESIQYNPRNNCLDGLSLRLGSNGFPVADQFPAKTAEDIKSSIDSGDVAPYINLIMAQPQGATKHPAFCLSTYPSNNKFNYKHCLNRWNYLTDLFKMEGNN